MDVPPIILQTLSPAVGCLTEGPAPMGPSPSVNIPQHIRLMIESLQCPKHHKHPMLLLDGEEEITVQCCCPDFKKQCLYLMSKFMVVRQRNRMQWLKEKGWKGKGEKFLPVQSFTPACRQAGFAFYKIKNGTKQTRSLRGASRQARRGDEANSSHAQLRGCFAAQAFPQSARNDIVC